MKHLGVRLILIQSRMQQIALVTLALAQGSLVFCAEEGTPAKPEAVEPVKTEPVQRKPVPGVDSQADMTRRMKDVFKEDYKKKGADELSTFAKKLLSVAELSTHDPVQHYTTLRESYSIAAGANDFETAFAAVDQLSTAFVLDNLEMKITTLLAASKNNPQPDAQTPIINAGVALWDTFVAADQYDAALKVAQVVEVAAKVSKSEGYISASSQRLKETREFQAEYNKIKDAILKKGNEAESSTALGRFYCLIRNDWTKGLPLLVKGSDEVLKSLASREKAENPEEIATLADNWNDYSAKLTGLAKARGMAHAQSLYEKAIPGLTGLNRAKAEKRLDTIQVSRGVTTVNLLSQLNIARDTVFGKWKVEGGSVISDVTPLARIMFPYQVPEEYDFHIDFVRPAGNQSLCMILSKGGHDFMFEFAQSKDLCGFSRVDEEHIDASKHAIKLPFANGKRYNVTVQVRNHGLRALVDGKIVISLPTDYKNLTPLTPWQLPDHTHVGFGTYGSPAAILVAELIEVTGKGKFSPKSNN